jgi:prophage tail gpP-like protein
MLSRADFRKATELAQLAGERLFDSLANDAELQGVPAQNEPAGELIFTKRPPLVPGDRASVEDSAYRAGRDHGATVRNSRCLDSQRQRKPE